ncbi:hypothetical protein CTEN210_00580 [Chaetoceros tenuissimus]|uniref:Uncharacterized protein n=1 Tax=Chaetoceros tenuissimus TaxID=426638 RepID=A0AAD3CFZ5_9STRA|nr:hypothetical protein CTEN210_00580 [Chaetoceros tenuissimus]
MNISTFQSNLDFIKSLYLNKEWKDKKCRDEILEAIEEANEKIEKAFGESMCMLYNHKPSVEAVEKVVKKFPSTLSHQNEDGRIPIQKAATNDGHAFEYVPVLAKEGIKHKVGGEDARGGLLTIDPTDDDGWNTLEWFVNVEHDDDYDEFDAKRVKVLKELRKSGLLLKEDIQEHKLLDMSCWKKSKKRFEYLASWDPDALIDTRVGNHALVHTLVSKQMPVFLKASFKYHPQLGGLLFVKDDDGEIAFDTMCNIAGEKETMTILYELLTPKSDYPILHHIFTNAPRHKELFMEYFPWATQLKDHHGRSLQQAVLAADPNIMNEHSYLFAMLTDDQIQERDPVTTLYPFAAMAVGEHADLKKSYYLLRRHPSVLDRRARAPIDGQSISRRRRKRKRGNGSNA